MTGSGSLIHRLWFRLTTAFLLVAIIGVLVVALLANQAAATSFRRYLTAGQSEQWQSIQQALGASYESLGDWSEADTILTAIVRTRSGSGQYLSGTGR
ncbi:MAG: hypothetical protein R3C44_11055 [Chloroflexota bacterium]